MQIYVLGLNFCSLGLSGLKFKLNVGIVLNEESTMRNKSIYLLEWSDLIIFKGQGWNWVMIFSHLLFPYV